MQIRVSCDFVGDNGPVVFTPQVHPCVKGQKQPGKQVKRLNSFSGFD